MADDSIYTIEESNLESIIPTQVQLIQRFPRSVGEVQIYLVQMSDGTQAYIPSTLLTTTVGVSSL